MRSIVFNTRPGVAREDQASLLARLGRLPGVRRAAALSPNSKSDVVRRMCYADVDDSADIDAVRDRIANLPEVESADVPAGRRLIEGAGGSPTG